jgi:hypothetical protein
VLAITGSEDQVVPPTTSDVLVQAVASTDTTREIIDGADHEYQATSDDQTHADEVIRLTNQWLIARLDGGAGSRGDVRPGIGRRSTIRCPGGTTIKTLLSG